MDSPPSATTVISVDATCSLCGRTFKSKRGMNIHKRVCIQKRSTNASADTKTNEMHQRMTASTTKNTTTQDIKIKIINLLTKKDKNKYICPNSTCQKILKAQGATMHVKTCAKTWLTEQQAQI